MPKHDSLKYLYDIVVAGERIVTFIADKSFEEYKKDLLLQSGVERQFGIIGEALNQALKVEPSLVDVISNTSQIIAFRNILIHRYASVSNEVVWGVIESFLLQLIQETKKILHERSILDNY